MFKLLNLFTGKNSKPFHLLVISSFLVSGCGPIVNTIDTLMGNKQDRDHFWQDPKNVGNANQSLNEGPKNVDNTLSYLEQGQEAKGKSLRELVPYFNRTEDNGYHRFKIMKSLFIQSGDWVLHSKPYKDFNIDFLISYHDSTQQNLMEEYVSVSQKKDTTPFRAPTMTNPYPKGGVPDRRPYVWKFIHKRWSEEKCGSYPKLLGFYRYNGFSPETGNIVSRIFSSKLKPTRELFSFSLAMEITHYLEPIGIRSVIWFPNETVSHYKSVYLSQVHQVHLDIAKIFYNSCFVTSLLDVFNPSISQSKFQESLK